MQLIYELHVLTINGSYQFQNTYNVSVFVHAMKNIGCYFFRVKLNSNLLITPISILFFQITKLTYIIKLAKVFFHLIPYVFILILIELI